MESPRKRSLVATAVFLWLLPPGSFAQETEATKKLKARGAEFRRDVVEVTNGVYTAVGYGASTISMIEGRDGVIIVDPGQHMTWSEEALAAFRRITDKPVKAIIYTHSHGDHTSGAKAFAGQDSLEVWARANFGSESDPLASAGLTINRLRGQRQAGFALPPEKRINNGVAPAVYPRGGGGFTPGSDGFIPPTRQFSEERKRIEIAGVNIELVAAPGEPSGSVRSGVGITTLRLWGALSRS